MNTTFPSPDALLSDPLYPRLKEHVVESTGLAYYEDKDEDLVRRIGVRLSSLGVSGCASYLEVLRDPLRGPAELDALAAEITIGETYFFRHREHFDALRDIVLPDLIERNRAHQGLRIWCAGCADGAEPYSLAILLKREMAFRLPGWEVSILGTDINRHSLARAREGRFEAWALRSTPEDTKRTCFSREGKLWNIAPEYKERVSFQYHNLVEHSFPSLLNNLSSFDLIVCRNVMIYFGADLMRRIVGQFHECLVPGAWLLVGPTEPNMTYFTSFQTVNAPGVTLYQRHGQFTANREANLPGFAAFRAPPASEPVLPVLDPPAGESIEPTLADVRRHADRGAWVSAARFCEQLLERDNLNSAVHFHHALILEQMRMHTEAERSLRRAIYLDRQSVLPHYYLGLFLQSRGKPRHAVRSFENALELLSKQRDDGVFEDADGISVAEMKKLATMHLDILREPLCSESA